MPTSNSPLIFPNATTVADVLTTIGALRRLREQVVTIANVSSDPFDVPAINSLFDEVAAHMPVPRFVRGGFSGLIRSKSLANIMVDAGNIDGLERLVSENKHGVTLEDLCSWQRQPEFDAGGEYVSLAETAFGQVSAKGLALALKLRPNDPSLSKLHDGNSTALQTMHYRALRRAMNLSQPAAAQKHLDCAQLLQEHGAPFLSSTSQRNPVASTLLSAGWKPELAESLSALLRKYHSAGQLDLDEPLDPSFRSVGDMAPLVAAIKNGNAVAAKDLIALGCNYKALMYGTKDEDILHLVRSNNLANEAEMLSSITAGFMEREISEATVSISQQAPARAARRTLRAAL